MTAASDLVELPERSSRAITKATYRALEDSSDFLALIDAGVVSLARTKQHGYTLKAGPYVGEALLESGLRIRVNEKAKGSLASLVRWALPTDARVADAPAPVAPDSFILKVFVERLLDHIGGYLREGRLKAYSDHHQLSSSPRGRIDVRATLRAQARGDVGRVAHIRPVLSADLLVNRLLARSLVAADAYASAHGDEGTRTRVRGLAALFDDVSVHRFERMPPDRLRQAFQEAQHDRRVAGDLRGALAYGQALLLHWGAWADPPAGVVPQSFFLKLETLFEDAVRSILEAGLDDQVINGTSLERFVFPKHQDAYDADPDLVIGPSDSPTLVGDCKYRQVTSGPGHSDVYQLLVHTETFGGAGALLVYPGTATHCTYIGVSASGTHLWWSEVRLPHLAQDVLAVAQALGLSVQTGASEPVAA